MPFRRGGCFELAPNEFIAKLCPITKLGYKISEDTKYLKIARDCVQAMLSVVYILFRMKNLIFEEKVEKIVIIDGNSLINRAFYALPPLTASDGTPSGAVYGFATMLIRLITELRPNYLMVAFDTKAPTFRHIESDSYKATRKGMPDELAAQLAPLKKLLALMGIRCIEQEGFEADDIIGTVAKKCKIECIIVTGDKDSLQLVDSNISVMLTKRGITDVLLINEKNFETEIGLRIEQIVDYKALRGDPSDNIPGIAGIGDKTATNLLHQYDSLDGVYKNIDLISGSLKDKLAAGKESAYLSQRLATICTSMQIEWKSQDFCFEFPFSNETKEYLAFLGFRSILKRDELFVSNDYTPKKHAHNQKNTAKSIQIASLAELEAILSKNFDVMTFYCDDKLHFAFDDEIQYELETTRTLFEESIDFYAAMRLFANAFENSAISKLLFDAKSQKKQLKKMGIELRNYQDVKLMQYLVDMSIDYSSVKTLLQAYNCDLGGAAALFGIFNNLLEELERLGMTALYREIELPLIDVLLDMEEEGFAVDVDKIIELETYYSSKMKALTERIHFLSGSEFNVNSPKQLADILFNKMGIPYPKKSNKYSTSADILGEISSEYEIIDCILEYRTYAKLNNTYIDGLKKLAFPSGVIHTEFKQTVTVTGRLSSVEPNLQNIPIRDEEGRLLRAIFVSKEGRTLIAADYSQIELRLLAHYSGDEKLVAAYHSDQDIHTEVAAEIFGVSKEQVTPKMRRDAKAVNFGIIYGISDFGLAKNLKISRFRAKKYIETYFERFSSIKQYLHESVETAKKLGYAESFLGRKRKIPELYSSNFNKRSFGERAAMNMPLQGTAADIVKIAMLRVSKALIGKKSKLILQVHDELIIDTHDDELEEIKTMLHDIMVNAVELTVPLEVGIASGKRWSDCK